MTTRPNFEIAARRPRERGQSLIEVMAAMVVLAIGLIGAFTGISIAMRQNSFANRESRAVSIAEQVRSGIALQGYARLTSANGVLNADHCAAGANPVDDQGRDLTNGLNGLGDAHCMVDLDAYDTAIAGTDKTMEITPGYSADDATLYKRYLVYFNGDQSVATVSIVISWQSLLKREYLVVSTAVYNPSTTAGNGGKSQI